MTGSLEMPVLLAIFFFALVFAGRVGPRSGS